MTAPVPDTTLLRRALEGDVVAPGDAGWDAARQAWNLTVDQRPALVVLARSAADVAATVRFAAAHGLRVAAQSTGHGATSMGDLAETILLKTSRLTAVTVDSGSRTATVQAGALWRDVVAPAAEHGLVGLHGLSGSVGVAGYVLGGGIGWLTRRHGFASTHVRAFEVVGADGQPARVDAASEPELFWALRGGGGRPVVVTAFELELFELRQAFAGALMWPVEAAEAVLDAWREWIAAAPDEVSSTIRLVRYPPLPTVPDHLRGHVVVEILLAFTGPPAQGDALIAPLRAVPTPFVDTVTTIPAAALADVAGDPTDPTPAVGNAALVDRIGPEEAGAFLEIAGPGVDTPLVSVEIRHLGGALRAADPDPGAAGRLDAEGLLYATARATSPEAHAAILAAQRDVTERMAPFSGERDTILTFDERPTTRRSFAPGVADRLRAIADARDPEGLFVANHAD